MEQALLLRFISVYLQIIERKNILFHKLENPTSLNDYDDISAGNLNLCFHRTCTFDSRTNCIWKLSHIHFNGYISPFLLLNSNRARSDQILICRHNKTFGNRAKKQHTTAIQLRAYSLSHVYTSRIFQSIPSHFVVHWIYFRIYEALSSKILVQSSRNEGRAKIHASQNTQIRVQRKGASTVRTIESCRKL